MYYEGGLFMNIFFYRTGWALLLYMLYEPEWEKTFYCFQSIDQVPAYFVEKELNTLPLEKIATNQINSDGLSDE